ncbi:hypothetical protein FQN49_001717 [Arthroderma sp. PD_2]|nr:hypothetical protein FQN49_001717 [Arthroderma sp. PD_2]
MPKTPSDEDVITHLSHRPAHILKSLIHIDKLAAKPSAVEPRPSPAESSIGLLDLLPLEIFHDILNLLDFQSLSRFLRVSQRGRATVESLPAYYHLTQHAPDTLSALGQSHLISYHSAGRLHAVLRSAACVACKRFGVFLFLPTCERCCNVCSVFNESFWLMPLSEAEKAIPQPELKNLPVMQNIPGVYGVSHRLGPRRLKFVGLRAARELAKANVSMGTSTITSDMTDQMKHDAPLEPVLDNPSLILPADDPRLRSHELVPSDLRDLATIEFPYLQPDNSLEHGHWCKGCQWRFSRWCSGKLPANALDDLVPFDMTHILPDYAVYDLTPLNSQANPFIILHNLNLYVRSKSELLTHVVGCYGVDQILSTMDIGRWN